MIKFNKSFPTGVNTIGRTLDKRKESVLNAKQSWYYGKYAYFKLTSKTRNTSGINSTSDRDGDSIFSAIPLTSTMTISTISNTDGYLEAFHQDTSDIRTLRPKITSVSINSEAGSDIVDSAISSVDINFKVYTIDGDYGLDTIEKNFFILGAKATIKFGWLGEEDDDVGNDGEMEINIYNFGFTMNNDGSFDCNIKALTSNASFIEAQSITNMYGVNTDEATALGIVNVENVSMAQKLKAKAQVAINSSGIPTVTGLAIGEVKKSSGTPAFYQAILKTKGDDGGADEQQTFYYISFEDLITFIQEGTKTSFKFHTNSDYLKLGYPFSPGAIVTTGVIAITPNGSADPRKYIFQGGELPDYGQPSNFVSILNGASDIKNILVSTNSVDRIYNLIARDAKKNRKGEKASPPSTVSFIRAMSEEIFALSGGMVDIQMTSNTDDNIKYKDEYVIFNNTLAQKVSGPGVYTFEVLDKNSIVKDINITSDFDVELNQLMTIGRVKKGEFNIAPLKKLYGGIPTINLAAELNNIREESSRVKRSMIPDGINDSKVTALADAMRKHNTKTGDTFAALPFYLKLTVKIDGIHGIPFLAPITTDRLPSAYKNAGVHFLVIGVEHSFDGDGGWETTLNTVMKLK